MDIVQLCMKVLIFKNGKIGKTNHKRQDERWRGTHTVKKERQKHRERQRKNRKLGVS